MRKHLWAWVACGLLLLAGGCEKYASLDDFAQLEKRVAALENLCNQMNTNIASLQTLISALQNNDYITSVSPVTQDGKEVGYTISFAKSAAITIYHGKDGSNGLNGSNGKDGYTPVIGVRKDSDGIYYWTLDGSWMLDTAGNKIKAEGTDGKNGADGKDGKDGADGKDGKDGVDGKDGKDGKDGAAGTPGSNGQNGAAGTPGSNGQNGAAGADGKDGITPQLRITDGYWEVSYDNGTSWKRLGKATGENGTNGTPGTDGSDGDTLFEDITVGEESVTFKLSSGEEFSLPRTSTLDILFETTNLRFSNREPMKVPFTFVSASDDIMIEALSSADLKVRVFQNGTTGGYLEITLNADKLDEYSKVVVVLSDGTRTLIRTLRFDEMLIRIDPDEEDSVLEVESSGETMILEFYSSSDNYTVEIAESDQTWIHVVETKAMTRRSVTLQFVQNQTGEDRTADVKIRTGQNELQFGITQMSDGFIAFKDANFKAYCLSNFDEDGDGRLSMQEAEKITRIDLLEIPVIRSLKGIESMPNLTSLSCQGKNLESLDVSKNTKLDTLVCGVNRLSSLDISQNTKLSVLMCNHNQITTLDVSHNPELSVLDCSYNQLTTIDLNNNIALQDLRCRENKLTSLDVRNNIVLTRLDCSRNLLTSLDVNSTLRNLSCIGNELQSLDLRNALELEGLQCVSNPLTELDLSGLKKLKTLHCSGTPSLKRIDVSGCTSLELLSCYDCGIDDLNLSGCTSLLNLWCYQNELTELDVSDCLQLDLLSCGNNQLTTLDVSNLNVLRVLALPENQLKELNVNHNPELSILWCLSNQIQSLNLDQNPKLAYLYCAWNPIEELDVSKTRIGDWPSVMPEFDYVGFGESPKDYPLICTDMTTLKKVTLKSGWTINGITPNRDNAYIPTHTEIVFVD